MDMAKCVLNTQEPPHKTYAACNKVMVSPLSKIRPNGFRVLRFTDTSSASSKTRFMYSSKPCVWERGFVWAVVQGCGGVVDGSIQSPQQQAPPHIKAHVQSICPQCVDPSDHRAISVSFVCFAKNERSSSVYGMQGVCDPPDRAVCVYVCDKQHRTHVQ